MHLNLSHRPRRSRKYNLNWPQEPAYVGDDSFSGISCVVPGTPLTSSCLSQHVVVHATAVVVAHHLPRHLRLCGSRWRLSTSSPQPPAGLLYPLKQRINRQRSYIQRIYWYRFLSLILSVCKVEPWTDVLQLFVTQKAHPYLSSSFITTTMVRDAIMSVVFHRD